MANGIKQGQHRLVEGVIKKGLCVRCGACVSLCPYMDYFDGKVVVMDQCQAETWRCLQLCPVADYSGTVPVYEESSGAKTAMGPFLKVITARSMDEEVRQSAQYGGVVSTLLIYALEKGELEAAVLTGRGGDFAPAGISARDRSTVLKCAGSRYSASASLSVVNRAIKAGEERLGVVGLPCQMEALARMKRLTPDGEERSRHITLKIGLFCTWAVDYRLLEGFLEKEGLRERVRKYDIPPPPSEEFQVFTTSGERKIFPLSQVRPFVQPGCALCRDMTAEWADISVGTVEGLEGWNTVVVRSADGARLVDGAVKDGWIETGDLPKEALEHLQEAARNKGERGKTARMQIGRGE